MVYQTDVPEIEAVEGGLRGVQVGRDICLSCLRQWGQPHSGFLAGPAWCPGLRNPGFILPKRRAALEKAEVHESISDGGVWAKGRSDDDAST